MINQIKLLKNIGQFDNVTPEKDTSFGPVTLIFGENGKGKTTIASILRSVSKDDPEIVMERQRLGAKDSPHIVLDIEGKTTVFQSGTWKNFHTGFTVFDDVFVSENICSGGEVSSKQRQSLHEVIIGAKGIELNNTFQRYVQLIQEHNAKIRELSAAIPENIRGAFNVDDFCNLLENKNIDSDIQNAERRHEASISAETIHKQEFFQEIKLPKFCNNVLNSILGSELPELESVAVEQVKKHIAKLGKGGEEWLSTGMERMEIVSVREADEVCPYCVQHLSGSQIIKHYRSYFSQAYEKLKKDIEETVKAVSELHGDDKNTAFERKIREVEQLREFWVRFTDMPQIDIDTEEIVKLWIIARELVLKQLREKVAAPLEKMELLPETTQSIKDYESKVDEISQLSQRFSEANNLIISIKQQVQSDNVQELKSKLVKLKTQKLRFAPSIIPLCNAYIEELAAKVTTEKLRDKAHTELENYQKQTFAKYENLINKFLKDLLANFQLGEVNPIRTGAGASTSYKIVIDKNKVAIDAKSGPSFRNTLSAGDRNTLALAFFFASLELDPDLTNKIVVFDDPMTSLDEHRKRQTCKQIISVSENVKQIIVLSHSKSFLCYLWEYVDKNTSVPLIVERAEIGTELKRWNVKNDSTTDYDLRHEKIRSYARKADHNIEREVAIDLRPTLEAFLRVAYPEHFPPGKMLGKFLKKCRAQVDGTNEILPSNDIKELDELRIYANEFHHDTKPDCQKTVINDIELKNYAERTLKFIARRQ